MEQNPAPSFFMVSPIHHSSPIHIQECSKCAQNVTLENELEECKQRITTLEMGMLKMKEELCELRQVKVEYTDERFSTKPLTDEVINVFKIKAGNRAGRFVRNVLRELYPSSILAESSLSGRDGRRKLSQDIIDSVVEMCITMYPDSNRKTIMRACVDMLRGERKKLKKQSKVESYITKTIN